jgi:hypothetical protein
MNSRTPIIADKELFRLWYEFYRLALESSDKEIQRALKKSADFYADWHGSEKLHFDDWWGSHRHLFHDTNLVRVTAKDESQTEDNLYVTVPLNRAYGNILEEFKVLLDKRMSAKKRRRVPLVHRYSPTEIQGVKRESLRIMLDLQKHVFGNTNLKGAALTKRVLKFFSSERYKRKQNKIPASFFIDTKSGAGEHAEETDRNVRRYRQKAKRLMLNVASGVFPGKY